MREIITLQFGNYANYVGAHMWNIEDEQRTQPQGKEQPETDASVHFTRKHNSKREEVAAARVVIFDVAENFGSISRLGTLHPDVGSSFATSLASLGTWRGDMTTHTRERVQNAYKMELSTRAEEEEEEKVESPLEETHSPPPKRHKHTCAPQSEKVRFWGDYMKVPLHHKSIVQLGSSEFYYCPQGRAALCGTVLEEACDQVRYFAEECDSLQGFQVLLDADSGFTGVALSMLQTLKDEYPRISVLATSVDPFRPAAPPQARASTVNARRLFNRALCWGSLAEMFIPHIPLSARWDVILFPQLTETRELAFESSAVLATALSTATVPLRLRSQASSMTALCAALTPYPRLCLFALSAALPASFAPQLVARYSASTSFDQRCQQTRVDPPPLHRSPWFGYLGPFTPAATATDTLVAEWTVLRGVSSVWPPVPSSKAIPPDVVMRALYRHLLKVPCVRRAASCVEQPLTVPLLFPQFFREVKEAAAVPVATQLISAQWMSPAIKGVANEFSKLRQSKAASLQFEKDEGLHQDAWRELDSVLHSVASEFASGVRPEKHQSSQS